jgi:hypothetical protein
MGTSRFETDLFQTLALVQPLLLAVLGALHDT